MGCMSSAPQTEEEMIKNAFKSAGGNEDEIEVIKIEQVLLMLVTDITDDEIKSYKTQIPNNGNGKILYIKFKNWYLSSNIYYISNIRKIFKQVDKNRDGFIDKNEFELLLIKVINKLLNRSDENVPKEHVDAAIDILYKTDKLGCQEFVDWFQKSTYWEMRWRNKATS